MSKSAMQLLRVSVKTSIFLASQADLLLEAVGPHTSGSEGFESEVQFKPTPPRSGTEFLAGYVTGCVSGNGLLLTGSGGPIHPHFLHSPV